MSSILSAPHFHNEEAAYAFVEARIWAKGRPCPHCGVIDRSGPLKGKSTRIGVYKCYECRKPFTVKIGSIFEASHIPMRLWLQAIFLIASSKKGISSNQLHRTLGITLKSAWFMSHRIREAMKDANLEPFGGFGGDVEVDETFIGNNPAKKKRKGYFHKFKIVSLVDRTIGHARSVVIDDLDTKTLWPILRDNIRPDSRLLTDEAHFYQTLGRRFSAHAFTKHSAEEYVSKIDSTVHSNTVEGFFSIFKRGMKGIYQHCAHNHLHRYLTEFDFRYSNRKANGWNDEDRAEKLLRGVVGKRLTYQTTSCGVRVA